MQCRIFAFAALVASALSAQVASSPYAKLHPVPLRAARIHDGFRTLRIRVNVERGIPTMLRLLEQHGVVDNFRRLSGRKKVDRRGPLYTDPDLYKWMEVVAFVLETRNDPPLRATLDRLVDEVAAAQELGGYLNIYWVEDRAASFAMAQAGTVTFP